VQANRQPNEIEAAILVRSTENLTTTSIIDDTVVLAITEDWKKQDRKLNGELEVADAETAKTDLRRLAGPSTSQAAL
jgi:hypothetical protein